MKEETVAKDPLSTEGIRVSKLASERMRKGRIPMRIPPIRWLNFGRICRLGTDGEGAGLENQKQI